MNQQYAFHVSYFEYLAGDISHKNSVEEANELLLGMEYRESEECIDLQSESFAMKTAYPGTVIGLGYVHEVGGSFVAKELKNNSIKNGFSLDYVTGMPYWPSSSVKGTIRSAFEQKIKLIKNGKECETYYVKELLEQEFGTIIDTDTYNKLILEMFGSAIAVKQREGKNGAETQTGGDVFFDALVVKPDASKKILGLDYITSHKLTQRDKIGMDEPNPVKILKILPDVTLLFRFRLRDSVVFQELTREKKLELFEAIFMVMGIGAKTNTGYGVVRPMEEDTKIWKALEQQERRG